MDDAITTADVAQVISTSPSESSTSFTCSTSSTSFSSGTLTERTEAFEKEVLLSEIKRHNFHMTNVARALGLERSHLYKKCQQLGIDLQSLRKPD
jgi:DNA-binding NtrC family response regulator